MDTHDKIPPAYSYSPQPVPEAWKMRFSANSAWFFTDDLTVVDAWLKAHSDGVEVVPLFCGSDSDGKRDTAFGGGVRGSCPYAAYAPLVT